MHVAGQELILVGDRVLVRPEEGESVSGAGLILPASVADQDAVQSGSVVAVGPGWAVPPAGGVALDDDWEGGRGQARWVAMQARVGDLAVYHRKAAVEIRVGDEKLVVVPHAALLVLLRDVGGYEGSSAPQ